MKRIFLVVALIIVALFLYTITILQYIYITSINSVLPNRIILYVVVGFFGVFALFLAIKIILKQTYAYNKSYWIIIILLNPILGIVLYFIFARDFVTKKFFKTRPLISSKAFLGLEELTNPTYEKSPYGDIFRFVHETTGRSVYEDDTFVEILNNGDVFFPRLIEELNKAKDYIFMEFYIIKTDCIGRRVLDVLKEKALQGIKVHLIYDHFGSNKHLDFKYMKSLKVAGVHIGIFDPQSISLFNSNVNFRNHRKAIVIDGYVGFLGGINLGDEYNHQSLKFGFWRDTHILMMGNGVTSIQNVFIKDWYYITGNVIDRPMDKTNEHFPGLFSVVESGPDFENGLIRDIYLKMIFSAKKSIKIVTPYLIIEPELMAAIKIAKKSGVEISLLLPGKHDFFVVGFATESYYEQLLTMGVKIYEYIDCFVHSKILIIDDELASVGSVNFDPRSFHLNFEVTGIFANNAVKVLVNSFSEDISKSNQIDLEVWNKRGLIKRIIEGLFNLFSPIF
ncbi:MAG: cardiolipin synthase [Firmicutes bacterium]|nr:cardiolipin synthase [Bacillota bacterium]